MFRFWGVQSTHKMTYIVANNIQEKIIGVHRKNIGLIECVRFFSSSTTPIYLNFYSEAIIFAGHARGSGLYTTGQTAMKLSDVGMPSNEQGWNL